MAFPQDILDTRVHLFYSGVWNVITSHVRGLTAPGGRVRIERGRPDEAGQSRPTTTGLTLNNRDGRFSPRNPTSPLFGLIGRNTRLRCSVGEPHVGGADSSATASTSHVAPSVTAAKAGRLICAWAGALAADAYTVPASMTAGPLTVGDIRMASAHEAVTGAGATGTRTATLATARTWVAASVLLHGTSVAVQETLSGVGTTAAASDVTLTTGSGTQVGWWLVAIQSWDYISESKSRFMPDSPADGEGGWLLLADTGTLETSSVVRDQLRVWARRVERAGAQKVTFFGMPTPNLDNYAHLYVLSGVDPWWVRATVEVPAWPQRWDTSGTDVWVPLDGAGIMRRLGQGRDVLGSAIRRAVTGKLIAGIDFGTTQQRSGSPKGYWPLEDGRTATTAAAGLPAGAPMQAVGGTVAFASAASQPAGSASLPDLLESTGNLTAPGPPEQETDNWTVTFVVAFDGTAEWQMLDVNGGQAFNRVQLRLSSTIVLVGIDATGVVTTIGTLSAAEHNLSDGRWYHLALNALVSAGDTVYRIDAHNEDGTERFVGNQFGNPVGGGGNPGPVASVTVRPRTSGTSAAAGHLAVWAGEYDEQADLIVPALDGYTGETAGRRMERLCGEEQIAFHPVGTLDDTAMMGPQTLLTLLTLLRECESVDLGVLYEPREAFGLAYRTRTSLYNQAATLALTYGASGEVAPPLEPTPDDQLTRNDVTVTRAGATGVGGSARAVEETGPLSVATIGRYPDDQQINVASDRDLPDQAGWRRHLGTVDEDRYPTIRVNLAALGNAAKTALLEQAAALDIGDLLSIAAPPAWLPPDEIAQLAQGFSETLAQKEWEVGVNAAPASPFTVGVWAPAGTPGPVEPKRYDTAGSELAAAFVAGTNTSMTVATTSGPLWTIAAADLPLDVRCAGARLRATAVGAQQASLRSVASVASGTTNSFTVSAPAGLAAGDVLVLTHSADIGTLAAMTATGGATWQQLTQLAAADGNGGVKVWWKVAGGSEPASYTLGQASGSDGVAAVAAVTNGRPVTPDAAVLGHTGTSTAVPTPSTGPVAGSIELRWASAETNVTWTPPSGFTEQADVNSGGFVAGTLASRTASAAQTGVHDFTASATAADRLGVTVNVIGTQVCTVQQNAVNGVVKTIPAGTPLSLWQPARYAL